MRSSPCARSPSVKGLSVPECDKFGLSIPPRTRGDQEENQASRRPRGPPAPLGPGGDPGIAVGKAEIDDQVVLAGDDGCMSGVLEAAVTEKTPMRFVEVPSQGPTPRRRSGDSRRALVY